jgi:hypothetical protein
MYDRVAALGAGITNAHHVRVPVAREMLIEHLIARDV